MKTGVVTCEIACARPIHALCTGPSRPGLTSPARTSSAPIAPAARIGSGWSRHQKTAASPRNAAPTAKANLRPSAGLSRAGTPVSNPPPPSFGLRSLVQELRAHHQVIDERPHAAPLRIRRAAYDPLDQ